MQRDGRATSTMTSTMTGKERYEARQLDRCRKAYNRGRAAAKHDAKGDAKGGEPRVTPNPYEVTDPGRKFSVGYRA